MTVMESSGPRKNACGEIRGKLFRDLILAGVVHERRITRIRGKVRFISLYLAFLFASYRGILNLGKVRDQDGGIISFCLFHLF